MAWCETNVYRSTKINVTSTKSLIEKLTDFGFSGVFVSSSQVYDGEEYYPSEQTKPKPLNRYGDQKLKVETFIESQHFPFAIIRPTKVLGKKNKGIFFELD